MAKLYALYDWKLLGNNSRYSLGYFLDQDFPSFIQDNFPQYDTQATYKATYGLQIQELLDDKKYNSGITQRFAVIDYDDLSHSEQQLLLGMQDVWSFMNVTRDSVGNQAQARNRLKNNTTLTQIDNTTFEINPETVDGSTGETYPARYLYL